MCDYVCIYKKYILVCCLVHIIQALLSLGLGGAVYNPRRYNYIHIHTIHKTHALYPKG
jgi:hypothetical protein